MNKLRQWKNLFLLELEIQYLILGHSLDSNIQMVSDMRLFIVLFMQNQPRATPNNEQNEVASHGQYRWKLIISVGEMLHPTGKK